MYIFQVRQQYRPAGDEGIILGEGFGDILEMKMKNSVTGIRGDEHEHRAALIEVPSKENIEFYFPRLINYFFTKVDVEVLVSIRLNYLRIPFNSRHCIKTMTLILLKVWNLSSWIE